ncbi:VOC family protein [Algoriphagus halophilus]|uniref:Catechol 2,3-dioxygenase n=1 Tax=Algoriphagus halophilus TaxID=226505 RepID=A0A1N6D2H5_9BACT|nr:VOC family protein [Algoriphagus halophilus]SIN64897.1 Catechol 2,3-dioxygenase [Algoriphagus halophilus]
MKALLTFLLFSGVIMTSHSQIKVNHIAVHVSELEASKKFYENIVGLKEIEEPFKDGLHAWYDIGSGAALHIIEAPNTPTEISKVNHLCFSMEDMDSFIQTLKDTNYPFESWVGEKGKVTIRVDGIRQIYIQDPDGMWLEINDDY